MSVLRVNNLDVLDARFRNIALSSKSNIPLISDKIVVTKTTDRSYEKFNYWAGINETLLVSEDSVFPSKDIKQGDGQTINVQKYGVVINVTKEMVDDNEFTPIMDVVAKSMTNCMVQTRERIAVNLLNNGFDSTQETTPDGVALFSASHVLKQTGALQSNTATAAALDLDSLWAGINTMKTTLDDSGLYASIYLPKFLVVPQALERRANELIKSEWIPQTTENTANIIGSIVNLSVLTSPLLTSTTAWFLVANPAEVNYYGLIHLQRESLSIRPLFDVKGSADLGNSVDRDLYSWRAKERYNYGLVHWNGLYGNQGA